MAPKVFRLGVTVLTGALFFAVAASPAQTQSGAPMAQSSTPQTPVSSNARARRRAARRRARSAQQLPAQQPDSATQVGPTPAQRARDAQILAAQKTQSSASARENDALTQKVIQDQQRQQAEPRIQDAPGPDSQPLPGNPAVQPAPASEPDRIQDAPGPAQTLPKAPVPDQPATPTPAPQ